MFNGSRGTILVLQKQQSAHVSSRLLHTSDLLQAVKPAKLATPVARKITAGVSAASVVPKKSTLNSSSQRAHKPKVVKPRLLSPYNVFCKTQHSEIQAKNPDAKTTDIIKLVGAEWKALTDSEKELYVTEANMINKPISVEREKYEAAKKDAKTKRGPLKPYTSFYTFTFPKAKADNPSLSTPELAKKIGALWKALSPAEKAKLSTEYFKQVLAWKVNQLV